MASPMSLGSEVDLATDPAEFDRLHLVLDLQKRASRAAPYPTEAERRDRLDRAIAVIVDHRKEIEDTISREFGNRSRIQTDMIDLMSAVGNLKDARKNLGRWMKPEKRRTNFPLNLLGGKSYIFYQPLGVVGVVVPWNAPIALSFVPLSNILAAGNRAMIKLPEQVPETSALIKRMIARAFDEDEVAAFEGGVAMGQTFTGLPFDHLLFTGGAGVARHVMAAAAKNLTPVTLELGGKAAVLLGSNANIDEAIPSTLSGKLMNGGQVCMGVDYLLVQNKQRDHAVAVAKKALAKFLPTVANNPDFTNLISATSFKRVKALVDDARQRGAEIYQPEAALAQSVPNQGPFCYPPTLVIDPPEDSEIMQHEVFGPVLPIVGYETFDEALAIINRRERPLGMYFFGPRKDEQQALLRQTWSGGVTINEVMMHVMMSDLPGGGVGESGTGRYVGIHGFRTFSNQRAVFENGWLNLNKKFRPPYGKFVHNLIESTLKK